MKPLIIFVILLITTQVNAADEWTRDQILLQGIASTLKVIDWGQTLHIADNPDEYNEINPIIGEHPTRAEVNRYCICSMGLHLLITHLLPSKYRKYWLGSTIMVSGYLVNHNYRIGLRVNF